MSRVLHVTPEAPGFGDYALAVDGKEVYCSETPVPDWAWIDAIRLIDPTGFVRTVQAREALREIHWERTRIAESGKP